MTEALTFEESDVQEAFYERGWSDGFPIVAPTPERVEAMLDYAGLTGDIVLGRVENRNREVTAEKAAINAVMAGCRTEYFPVVVAALAAMLEPEFNAHTVLTSTGGAAVCLLVSGPLVEELGFASLHNAMGAGNRANATIGRAVRLVARNVLGAVTGTLDGSSIGHPGKYSLVIAEHPPSEPWEPLRVELGYGLDDTTVTVLGTEGPRQIGNLMNGDPAGLLDSIASSMRCPGTYPVGKGSQVVVVLGHEHRMAIIEGGWTRQQVREYLVERTRITPEELTDWGVILEHNAQHDMVPGPDGKLPTVPSADDVFLVTAGGPGAGWSAYLPVWAPKQHSVAQTRHVAGPGEGLPLGR